MKRITGLFFGLAFLLPVAAHAQKPSDIAETRSADVYMDNAEKETLASAKNDWYQKAIAIALQAAQKAPTNPKPWFQIGKAYAALGDYVGADSAFTKAQTMYPEYAKDIAPMRSRMWTSIYNEGVKKIKAGDAPGGIQEFELAAKMDPSRFETQQVLGSIYLQTQDLPNAEKAYRAELAILRGPDRAKLDPKREAIWADAELSAVRALATMMSEQKNYAGAEEMYRELLKKDPQNAAVLSNLAITLSAANKTADANAIYNQLLARTDLTPNQLLNVGIGLNNSGDYTKAAQAFDRALQLNPYSHDVLDYRIHALTGAVDELTKKNAPVADIVAAHNQVIAAGQKMLEIDPANAPVLLAVADAQRQNGEVDKANVDKWKRDVLATLTALDKLPYAVVGVQSDADDKSIMLQGQVMGLEKSKPGTNANLRFFVVDKDGKTLGQKDVTVVVPAKDQMTPFTVTLDAPATAVAWKYQILP